jgi:hypothetical protein
MPAMSNSLAADGVTLPGEDVVAPEKVVPFCWSNGDVVTTPLNAATHRAG